jgi:class 3 adenylate cyclase/predicted ATPase
MNVADWLRALGLGQYEAAFRENSVTADLLPNLTPEDLKDLGIRLVGHRRRLLDAISALRTDADLAEHPRATSAERPRTAQQSTAERRQLSVMFCDLIDSTPLSSRLDPEELSAVIRGYQARVAAIIPRFGGFIARYVGDGILIYFGWPEAHETDAESAVRSALAVIAAVNESPVHGQHLSVRIGIATGVVVVGSPIGEGDAWQQTAIGETPNLAARLQNLAGPNGIVIDSATRRQIGGFFKFRDLGTIVLKGLPNPVPAWEVLEEAAVESRFEALRAEMMTPLVAREEELELLLRRWVRARSGEGQVVLLSGEPGVGKSRLTAALVGELSQEEPVRLHYFCSPHQSNSPLHPFIAQLERASDFERSDTVTDRLNKLDDLLLQTGASPEDAGLIADLLSLPLSNRYPMLELSPVQRRQRTLEAVISQVEALAAERAVLIIFEDTHWADPTSLELLDRIIIRLQHLRVLVILSFRPDFVPPWTGLPLVTSLTLDRLSSQDAKVLVERVAGDGALGLELLAEIVERADGVPLFLEELTKSVLEGTNEEGKVSSTKVPTTLQSSLMARLDRLGRSAKELAQIGSVIGREFPHDLALAVGSRVPDDISAALHRLVEADLLFRRGSDSNTRFIFKHALVQEAAYRSLLNATRQKYHLQIAQVLSDQCSEFVVSHPETLAHHYSEGGLPDRATIYWHKAGQHAAQRSAHKEAAAYLTRGLDALSSLPDTSERDKFELELQIALGPVLMAIEGYASPNAGRAYHRAQDLCHRLRGPPQIFQVLVGLRQFNHIGGALRSGRQLGEQLLALAQKTQDPIFLVQAHTFLGHSLCYLGDFQLSREHLEKGMTLYDQQQHSSHVLLSGLDPGVLCLSASAWVLWHLGYPDQALERAHAAILLATQLSHPQSLAQALGCNAQVHQFRGEPKQAREFADKEIALANKRGFQMRVAMSSVLRGWAIAEGSDRAQGIAQMRQGIAAYRATGAAASITLYQSLLAEKYESTEDAHLLLEEALAWATNSGEQWREAEMYRLKGMLLLRQVAPDTVQAERYFQRSLDISKNQHAKSWQLRTSVDLSRLWMSQGKHAAARKLLSKVFDWFTEGASCPDLREARQLLAELDRT